ncbi:Dimethylaniline monooxygenase 1 [Escovopsis weberi]|uniref:Dimethylaniline monooxygenase 1 n=1 Tax=Escovopsis weberi TaxID=150374 RepID=A0A0N0RTR0_ESCWE|nr:Dimethylaniline monooxygenase 1 [Escovopsis weberi]
MKVAVIGAGPAGLVTLKYLTKAHESLGCSPVQVQLFEYLDQLVSSKQLTLFSDFRSKRPEDFLKLDVYVQYLRDYCTHFNLWPSIRLQTRVVAVTRRPGGGHTVAYESVSGGPRLHWDCDAVAVCSGLHVTPHLPNIKGLERVPLVIHSSQFKARKQFGTDKTVLLIGTGETGTDLAHLAVTSPTRRVVLCHRDGFHFAPKKGTGAVLLPLLGRKPNPSRAVTPLDVARANLFDTAYVHPWLRDGRLLWDFYHYQIKFLLWCMGGTSLGVDQWIGGLGPERDHPSKIFLNKSAAVSPYISELYRPRTPGWELFFYSLRSLFIQTPIKDTGGRRVDLAPLPSEFDSDGYVHFMDNGRPEYERLKNERIKPDMVVLCTGYKQDFPFFEELGDSSTPQEPYPRPVDAGVRGIWKRDEPTVGFIGFMRPSLGAIPPLAELQAQLWIANLLAPRMLPGPPRPELEKHFRLDHPPESRINYGVDHESYAYQLAVDLGSAPGLTDILGLVWERPGLQALKLLLIWGLGANFNTKYRVMGPWKWDEAVDVLTSDEFWHTLTRRPLVFGHLMFSLVPMAIFGPLSALLWLYTLLFTLPGPFTPSKTDSKSEGMMKKNVSKSLSWVEN